jgi:hypothetical protein
MACDSGYTLYLNSDAESWIGSKGIEYGFGEKVIWNYFEITIRKNELEELQFTNTKKKKVNYILLYAKQFLIAMISKTTFGTLF